MKKNIDSWSAKELVNTGYKLLVAVALVILIFDLIQIHSIPAKSIGGASGTTGQASWPAESIPAEMEGTAQQPVMPDFETSLRPMGELNRKNHILYPEDASSYIMPDNEVVSWYAQNTVLEDNGLMWKPDGKAVTFNYMSDNDLFDNPQDDDFWQNPDYYLTHGNVGDCEDFSLAFASILEAKGIPAKIIGVKLINGQYHWVVEYEFNGHIRYADINQNNVVIFQDQDPNIETKWVEIGKDTITIF